MTDYSIAHKRWQILAESLLNKQTTSKPDSSSVRCFQSFNLFSMTICNNDNASSEKEGNKWCSYSCPGLINLKIEVRLLPTSWNLSELAGFNNTGNVCVWPSEEVLAYYCIKHRSEFEQKSVCELGGGMTCLAGLTVALSSKADEVTLSDGNETSVDNIESIVFRNSAGFGMTKVSSKCIKWDRSLDYHEYKEGYHYILCADCVFFKDCVEDLISLIWLMLKPHGVAIVVAPSRSGSFDHFLSLLDSRFDVNEVGNYDDDVMHKHKENLSSNPNYNPDLHFPRMLHLKKVHLA